MRSIGFTKNDAAVQYIKGLVIGFGMFGAVILIGVLFGAFKFIELNSEANFIVILLFFFGFVFQGMFEEAVCRGYLMIASSHKKPIVYGIIANSLVFALMHCANHGIGILPIINLILFGIFASLYTLRTDNIWGIGAIHSVWNFVQGNFYGLSVSGTNQMPSIFVFESTGNELIDGGTFGPEGGICVTIVMIVGILLLLIPTKNSKENSDKCISCVQEGSVSR
jgi:membrane protease YdiL (CAAX protease family)